MLAAHLSAQSIGTKCPTQAATRKAAQLVGKRASKHACALTYQGGAGFPPDEVALSMTIAREIVVALLIAVGVVAGSELIVRFVDLLF